MPDRKLQAPRRAASRAEVLDAAESYLLCALELLRVVGAEDAAQATTTAVGATREAREAPYGRATDGRPLGIGAVLQGSRLDVTV